MKKVDNIYCISWQQISKIAPREVIEEIGFKPEGKDHNILDFMQTIELTENFLKHPASRSLQQLFSQVAHSGYRYLMFYNDN